MANPDPIDFTGPNSNWSVTPGSNMDRRDNVSSVVTGYHDIDLLESLLKQIINENTALIADAERALTNYNLMILDNNLKSAQLAEWPQSLGPPKDYISYEQYKALKTQDTRGSAYIIKAYNDAIRSASGTNAVDVVNVSTSLLNEALQIQGFLDDATGTISDSAEFRIVELFQDWAGAALRDTRQFRAFFNAKGQGIQQVPASEVANLTPEIAAKYQAIFQIKLNILNQNLNQYQTDLAKATGGAQADIYYKRFLAPALKVKLKITNDLENLVDTSSFLGQQANDAVNGLTSDYNTALMDQMSRNSNYANTMNALKEQIPARDTYVASIQQLGQVGTPVPQVFVSAALTGEDKAVWQQIAASNAAATSTSITPSPDELIPTRNPYLSLHNRLDGRDARDAHGQYLLRSNGSIIGDIFVIDDVRIDGVDISEHTHNGKDGSKPISGFAITEGSLPPEATSTDPPPIPSGLTLKRFQSKVLPPGVLSLDATLSWEGNIYHTYEIQITKDP